MDASSPLRLNSPNLRKLSSLNVSKNNRLHSFIRSQETYLASYAVEGKTAAASWNSPLSATGTPRKSLQNVELESGFGTPLLKPRTVLKPSVPTAEVQDIPEDGNGITMPSEVDVRTRGKMSRVGKEIDSGSKSAPSREHAAAPISQAVSSTRDKHTNRSNKKAPASKRHHSSKPGHGDMDEDHRARLAERRERRRAKKAIVDPKIKQVESDGDGDGDNHGDREQAKASKVSKKGAKGKGLKMPAGLALMHGFSATNIGKNRLTVGPRPVVGVFNKGKASTKTTVSKGKAVKLYPELFSEQRFLGQDERKLQRTGNSTDSSSDSPIAVEDDFPIQGRVERLHKPSGEKMKRGRAKAISESSTEDTEPRCSDDKSSRSPAKKRARAESPIWDIELQDERLPSDQGSEASDLSNKETRVSGTLVLDTRVAKPMWSRAVSTNQPSAVDPYTTTQAPIHSDISETSITPSHSASQAALHRSHAPLDVPPVAAFSKYFALPVRPGSAISCSAPASPPRLTSPALRQSCTVHTLEDSMPRLEELAPKGVSVDLGAVLEDPTTASLSYTYSKQDLAAVCPKPVVSSPLGFSPGLLSPAASMPASPVFSERLNYRPHLMRSSDQLGRPRQRRRRGSSVIESLAVTQDGASIHPDYVAEYDEAAALGPDVHVPVFLPGAFCVQVPTEISFSEEADVVYQGHITHSDDLYGSLVDGIPGRPGGATRLLDRRLMFVEDHFEPGFSLRTEVTNSGEGDDELLYGNAYSSGGHLEVAEDDAHAWDPDDAEDSGDAGAEDFHYPRSTIFDPEAAPLAATFGGVATATDLDDDLASESESGHDQSVLGSLPRFSQGRALLMGVTEVEIGADHGRSRVSRTEEDVARSLRGHWQPQRF
ncbi:hypothetical protein GY45DRAFT_1047398 [Cubamyces sp. BRFM 1775]|nr:hypothetical protein GY45DRAFT_1047398 [Cubamyces sp. BRFM 1775]